MNVVPIRLLTWLTVVAALVSAVLLAGGDAGLPDIGEYILGGARR